MKETDRTCAAVIVDDKLVKLRVGKTTLVVCEERNDVSARYFNFKYSAIKAAKRIAGVLGLKVEIEVEPIEPTTGE